MSDECLPREPEPLPEGNGELHDRLTAYLIGRDDNPEASHILAVALRLAVDFRRNAWRYRGAASKHPKGSFKAGQCIGHAEGSLHAAEHLEEQLTQALKLPLDEVPSYPPGGPDEQ